MSKSLVQTHAGDDSDGKIWGIEGTNILFILAGLLMSVGLVMMLFRHHPPLFSVGFGLLPFLVLTGYVFGFRQGKPKSYDTDLLETLLGGKGWMPSLRQPANPLRRDENS
jgi:hypothetical protein